MAEKSQRDTDAEAAGMTQYRMRLDAVLAEFVKRGEISIDASNNIRSKMSEDVNVDVDASKNVNVEVHPVGGTTESAKLDEKGKTPPPPRRS